MSDTAQIQAKLAEAGAENPAREAEQIAAAIAAGEDIDLDSLYQRRAGGTPLGIILGRVTFLGVELLSDPGALAPREETEILGRTAIEAINALGVDKPRVIDMCCGAGNLACAIAVQIPSAEVWASDLTDGCVSLSRRNVDKLGLTDRVHVHQGDLFGGFEGLGLEGTIDAVVCNPPYISSSRLDEGDRQVLLDHEPREAFDGGPYGLSIQTKVTKAARDFLRPGGWLMFEFGLGQEKQIAALYKRARKYGEVENRPDPDGNPRVALAQLKDA